VTRGIRNPGVRQCLGFCTADFLSSLAYESAEQKTQTLPNSKTPDTSVRDARHGTLRRERDPEEPQIKVRPNLTAHVIFARVLLKYQGEVARIIFRHIAPSDSPNLLCILWKGPEGYKKRESYWGGSFFRVNKLWERKP